MPQVFDVQLASGATAGGLPIPVVSTATPGTLIHTAVAGSVAFDEVYIWASNVTAASVTLTVEWGGAADPANHLVKAYTIPANSPLILIAPGLRVNNGIGVRAFASVANAINLHINVNTIR